MPGGRQVDHCRGPAPARRPHTAAGMGNAVRTGAARRGLEPAAPTIGALVAGLRRRGGPGAGGRAAGGGPRHAGGPRITPSWSTASAQTARQSTFARSAGPARPRPTRRPTPGSGFSGGAAGRAALEAPAPARCLPPGRSRMRGGSLGGSAHGGRAPPGGTPRRAGAGGGAGGWGAAGLRGRGRAWAPPAHRRDDQLPVQRRGVPALHAAQHGI